MLFGTMRLLVKSVLFFAKAEILNRIIVSDVKGLSFREAFARNLAPKNRCTLRRPVLRCPSKITDPSFVKTQAQILARSTPG